MYFRLFLGYLYLLQCKHVNSYTLCFSGDNDKERRPFIFSTDANLFLMIFQWRLLGSADMKHKGMEGWLDMSVNTV